jgi:hypothetical protein
VNTAVDENAVDDAAVNTAVGETAVDDAAVSLL